VFLREYANKVYGVAPYYLSKVASEVPMNLIAPCFTIPIFYFGYGLDGTIEQFFGFFLTIQAIYQAAVSYGYFTSSLFENMATASMVSPIITMPLILVGGFFSNQTVMPEWLKYFSQISPVNMCMQSLATNQWGHDDEWNSMLTRLGFERTYWSTMTQLILMAVTLNIMAGIALKLLISRVQ